MLINALFAVGLENPAKITVIEGEFHDQQDLIDIRTPVLKIDGAGSIRREFIRQLESVVKRKSLKG